LTDKLGLLTFVHAEFVAVFILPLVHGVSGSPEIGL
jgi:hypothetical protein